MNNKKRAFTLVELLAVVAISAILLFIATDRLIGDSFKANATYNQRVDVQTGVKTSMDNIKSILKRAVQVHLVGQEVYKEGMDLNKLDKKYNYIGFSKDAKGNRFLANIVYDKATNKFNVLPLTAGDKKDIMTGDKIDYNLEFFKNDNNYRKKLDNDMINLTITGKSSANVLGKPINDKFELKEDIQLPNVNQVLLSRHLQGGVDKITALAYDNGVIQPGKKAGTVGVVLVMDSSGSMMWNMVDPYDNRYRSYTFKTGPDEFRVGYNRKTFLRPGTYKLADVLNPRSPATTRKVVLGSAVNNVLLPMFRDMAVDKNLNFQAYVFDYANQLRDYSTGGYSYSIANPGNHSTKYFITMNMARSRGYGPFNLETTEGFDKAVETVQDKAGMKLNLANHDRDTPDSGGATNTGFALLAGLELVKQMEEEGISKRYLILLTDGEPNITSCVNNVKSQIAVSRAYYNSIHGGYVAFGEQDMTKAMKYIKDVTGSVNNPKDLYDKAFLIGLSGLPSEITRLGVPSDITKQDQNIPPNSINAYLRQTGNKTAAYEAKDSKSLETTFENIAKDIGVSLGVFDGPDKMK